MDLFARRGRPLVLQISRYAIAPRSPKGLRRFVPVSSWHQRHLHQSLQRRVVQPYLLADIGEGITECQIVSWSVKPGDKVEQFDPICEVSSDKATVEITSRFDGTITKLLYEEGEVAVVGMPILTLDVPGEDSSEAVSSAESTDHPAPGSQAERVEETRSTPQTTAEITPPKSEAPVTPAIRHMLKSANIDIKEVKGTGKDGRITKDDVQQYISASESTSTSKPEHSNDQEVALTPIENAMFRSMTESLKIPHFLFTHTIDFTDVKSLQRELNASASKAQDSSPTRLTPVSFVMKAISLALTEFPKLNSHLNISIPGNPRLLQKAEHNFGLAVDTAKGLLVPVVRGVEKHTIQSLAVEIKRLSELAQAGRLAPADFQNATFVVSNVGSIGGDAVAPVILAPMVGIVALGRIREVLAFREDKIVKKDEMTLSWSADHRIIDGATVAKAAKVAESWLENVEGLKECIDI